MFKNLLLISIIFSSTLYAIQNPSILGSTYNLKSSGDTDQYRPQEFKQTISKPQSFNIENKGHNWATLSWKASDNSQSVMSYHLYRNKILLAELAASQRIYKDTFLLQDQKYQYEVYAIGETGWRSPANSLELKTHKNASPKILNMRANINFKNINGIGNYIYTFTAQDKNNDKLYFKLKGKDANRFLLSQDSGKLINKKYIVRQKTYHLIIEVSDGMSRAQHNFTVQT